MSLNKVIKTPTGYDAGYWRISEVRINAEEQQMRVSISGYKDKAAFDDRSSPITTKRIHASMAEIEELPVVGAVDCFKSFLGKCEQIAVQFSEEFNSAVVDEDDTL